MGLGVTSASSVNPDEQEFVLSGASMHMMRKTEMTPDELKTVDVSRRPTIAIIVTTGDTMVCVKDWSCSSQSSSSNTPAVLPLGNSVQKMSSSCEWNAVKLRILLTKNKIAYCNFDNFVCTLQALQKSQFKVSRSRHHMCREHACLPIRIRTVFSCTLDGWLMIHWRSGQGLSDSVWFTNDCHLSIMSLLPSWQEWLQLLVLSKKI